MNVRACALPPVPPIQRLRVPPYADRASRGTGAAERCGSRSDPPRKFVQGVYLEALAVAACLERTLRFTPVVYTCGVSVLQHLRRTTAVLGGL
jgi:hypothetical protein